MILKWSKISVFFIVYYLFLPFTLFEGVIMLIRSFNKFFNIKEEVKEVKEVKEGVKYKLVNNKAVEV